jgi:hypothetical protein
VNVSCLSFTRAVYVTSNTRLDQRDFEFIVCEYFVPPGSQSDIYVPFGNSLRGRRRAAGSVQGYL